MTEHFDLAIVGSGFSGSLLSMIAKRLGQSVVLIEKTRHPRFAIGESSTPLANLLLDELATRFDLNRIRPLAKWGSWQKTYPEIGCGLKRGFTFYHHELNGSNGTMQDNELLVAASPHNGIADTHWYRPDFDHFLVREAVQCGVDYRDETTITCLTETTEGLDLTCVQHDSQFSVNCNFLVDATGPRGFLFNALGLPEVELPDFPKTEALYTHFTNVDRVDMLKDTRVPAEPPYPVDDAALHHVFDGGWIWILRFNNGITSAGVAVQKEVANDLNLGDRKAAWNRLLRRLPDVAAQFDAAEPTMEFVHSRNLSFLCGRIVGRRWALLPSAAGFVDPLLSTGLPLTLLGVGRVASIIEKHWDKCEFTDALKEYSRETEADIIAAANLVGALYSCFGDFELFRAVSKLYFAAVVFSESARRLNRTELADSFLLRKHTQFGPTVRSICERIRSRQKQTNHSDLIREIDETIQPIDLAGLTDTSRGSRFPVLATDLLDNCEKLGVDRKQVNDMLEKSGFWPVTT